MDKPRVLFILPLPPPVHGSSMVSQTIQDSPLVRQTFQVDFINLSTSRRMDEIGKGSWRKLIRFAGSYLKLLHRLLTRRYDACYLAITCHGVGFLKDAPFVFLCKWLGRKVIVHQHNKGLIRDVHRWPYRWLMPWLYRKVEVILLSPRLYDDVAPVVSPDQVHICPNGLEELVYDVPVPVHRPPIPHLLFLSNLLVSKGVWIFLDACWILKKKGYVFVCNYVGGETKEISRSMLETEIRRRGLEGRVFYRGPQYGVQKEVFFRQTDIFVQPTYEDCFPLTLVEAMQHGIPIVSTDEGAIPDMVEDGLNGLVCQRKDVHSLVNALEKLLNDNELRKQMGENGRFRYKERYTKEMFEKNFCRILSDILN